jgi:hypothetical protein
MAMAERPERDALIDTVARRLTEGDPPAHLRARALARLDERRSQPWMWGAAAVCAVGVVVAGAALGLHDRSASRVAPGAQAIAAKPTSNKRLAASSPIQAPAPGPEAPSLPPGHLKREARVTARAPSSDELAWRARAIPELAPPNALTVEEIQPAPFEIRPLVTTPLTVPAIGEEDENRNQGGPRP